MNIIVNGASRGIGRALVLRMSADKDNQILTTGRNESMLRELQMECLNGNVNYMKMDITEMNKEM